MEAMSGLGAATLIPLKKPDGGVRPVAPESAIIKLASLIMLQRAKGPLMEIFGPLQHGVGGNVEELVHELREAFESGDALLAMDFTNAYNTMKREQIS